MTEYNPERARAQALKRYYGLTVEQYDELLLRQSGCCAICERDASEFKIRLAVDHDHTTGEVRGLCCNNCNHRIVGRYHGIRDAELLRRVASYLTRGTGWFVPEVYKVKRRRRSARKVEHEIHRRSR